MSYKRGMVYNEVPMSSPRDKQKLWKAMIYTRSMKKYKVYRNYEEPWGTKELGKEWRIAKVPKTKGTLRKVDVDRCEEM